METIKYCYFNNDFISWMVEEKLIELVKRFTEVGQKYNENKGFLDLIKFKVNDLMRCQILGEKKKIVEVYEKIVEM
jgi:hypothetical protein